MNKLVILDRDGVINLDSDAFVKNADEWIPITNSIKAIARLYKAGYQIAVATNQSGLGRGHFNQQDLDDMHHKMVQLVEAEGGHFATIKWCPHKPDAGCECRKPLPGLIDQIKQELGLEDLSGAYMVGDSLRDLQAGEARGCKAVLVRTGKGEKTLATNEGLDNALVYDELADFIDWLLAQEPN
jgi:D-glycero-D-manno-heptose 1,7-bisphosphate phosphatase